MAVEAPSEELDSEAVARGDDGPEAGDEASAEGSTEETESSDAESGEGESRSSRSRRGRSRNRSGNGGEPGQAGQNAPTGQQAAQQPANNRRGRARGPIGDDVEPEILEDDVLIPVAGILDVLDNYAFVRTTGYLPGPTDVYVSLGQVKKYGLRKGDAVVGAIRQPRDGEQPGRQKYNALVRVDYVNGLTGEQSIARPEFAAATPIQATETLGAGGGIPALKGQRVIAVGGIAEHLIGLAESISAASPDTHLMVILVNPRPEDATAVRRSIKGEVIVSALEQSAEDHVTVVELAVERAKRLIELGIDVAILIDSVGQLGRAYHALGLAGRAGLDDPAVVLPVKRLVGAGRRLEDGASLTIVATALTHTAFDQLILAELGTVATAVVQLG